MSVEYPSKWKECEIAVKHLAPDIIIVAKQGYGGSDWAAYIGYASASATPEERVKAVVEEGTKLSHATADHHFPWFAARYVWRA